LILIVLEPTEPLRGPFPNPPRPETIVSMGGFYPLLVERGLKLDCLLEVSFKSLKTIAII
jgi:hypothetical protein